MPVAFAEAAVITFHSGLDQTHRIVSSAFKSILAKADPSARLRLVCSLFLRAALNAANPSGNKITNAMIIPTSDFGAPILATPCSIVGESFFASKTTIPRQSNNRKVLISAAVFVGGSA